MKNPIKIQTIVNAPVDQAWDAYTDPNAIKQWNRASEDWHCPSASNELEEGGKFNYTMASKDGKMSFDFSGKFTTIAPGEQLDYTLDDGRKVQVHFEEANGKTLVTQQFEPENQNSAEMQEQGWQTILDNYADFAAK